MVSHRSPLLEAATVVAAVFVLFAIEAAFALPTYQYRFAVSDKNCTGYPTSVVEFPDTCLADSNEGSYYRFSCDIYGVPTQRVCNATGCADDKCSPPVTDERCRVSFDGESRYQIGCSNLALPIVPGDVTLTYYGVIRNESSFTCLPAQAQFALTVKRCDYIGNNQWTSFSCSGTTVSMSTCEDEFCSENCETVSFPSGSCQNIRGVAVRPSCPTPTVVPPASSLNACENSTMCPQNEYCSPEAKLCVRNCDPIVTQSSFSQAPPAVGIFRFSLRDCSGQPLPILSPSAVAQKSQLQIKERGDPVSRDETSWVLQADPVPASGAITLILVDVSSSVTALFQNLTYTVNEFVEALITDAPSTQVSVAFFDGSSNSTSVLPFTDNLLSLRQAYSTLTTYSAQDVSTNFYGAIVSGVQTLEAKFQELGAGYSYNMIIFSDGQDEAFRVSDVRALYAVRYPTSRLMRLQVASVLINTGSTNVPFLDSLGRVFSFVNSPNITALIRSASLAVSRNENSFFKVAYCSAKRAGVHTATLFMLRPSGPFSIETPLMNGKLNATFFGPCGSDQLRAALASDGQTFNRYANPVNEPFSGPIIISSTSKNHVVSVGFITMLAFVAAAAMLLLA